MLKQLLNLVHNCAINSSKRLYGATTGSSTVWKELNKKGVTDEYLIKNDPDSFGSVSNAQEYESEENDPEEQFLKHQHLIQPTLRTKQYADQIKAHLHKREIKEAIDFLQNDILKKKRPKSDNLYLYNLVLGGCGRVGYTKMAFHLYNDMKKRDLQPTNSTYTALFNACSNSPWPETDGLTRARKLYEQIVDKQILLNDTNYNAAIKAFGRGGDVRQAFRLVDQMQQHMNVTIDTLNMLLQSCASDKVTGFRYALTLWNQYVPLMKPNIFTYNLMLRCVRDCGFGDGTPLTLIEGTQQALPGSSSDSVAVLQRTDVIKAEKPQDRLLLIGGFSTFLNHMNQSNVKPDIKTFTQMLDCIPSTLIAEKMLFKAIEREQIQIDVDFLNMLIKKRSLRSDYKNARAVLDVFHELDLRPDIITYGVLALSCQTRAESQSLLLEMNEAGYRMNIEILGAMLKSACIKFNFVQVIEMMEIVIREQIKPNQIFIQHLENFYKQCKKESNNTKQKGRFFMNGFKIFRFRYKTWSKSITMDPNEEIHPWQQFRTKTESSKKYKNPKTYFKPRMQSRYRQMKTTI